MDLTGLTGAMGATGVRGLTGATGATGGSAPAASRLWAGTLPGRAASGRVLAMRRMWLAVLLAALAGCPEDGPPACVTVETSCTPLYAPTFDNVFNNTLKGGCGSMIGSCHSASGAGKMSLADPAAAYASLLDGRVTPGDPGCSELIVRTDVSGKSYQMPPSTNLGAAERCSLIQWVAAGAPGPTVTAAPGAAQ